MAIVLLVVSCSSEKKEPKSQTHARTTVPVDTEAKRVESREERLRMARGHLEAAFESFRTRDEFQEDDSEFIFLLAISDLQKLRRDLLEVGFQPADPDIWEQSEKLQEQIVTARKRINEISKFSTDGLTSDELSNYEGKYRKVHGIKQDAIRDFLTAAGIDPEGRYAAELKVKISDAEEALMQAKEKLADAEGATQKKAAQLIVDQAAASLEVAKRKLKDHREAEYE